MLKALIAFSLRYPSVILVASALLIAYAGFEASRMSVDVFPELNAPTVTVITEAEGLAADEVEQYVTFPIESAVNGMTGIRRIRSSSTTGLSIVYVDLDWGADLYRARQLVTERLGTVRGSLPNDLEPFLTPVTSIAGEIMLISLSSPEGLVSPMELRSLAEFELRSRLLTIPGIAQAVAIGGEFPEFQVNADQEKLPLYGLTLEDVADAARGSHSTASAGYLADVRSSELPIRQRSRAASPRDIADAVATYQNGTPITIGHVADIELGAAPARGTASENGSPAVILSVQKSPGTNTLALTESIDEMLTGFESTLPAGVVLNRDVVRQSHFIERSVHNITKVLIEAVVIVSLVIMLFLMNVRATVITLAALPVSLAIGLLALHWMGLSLNVMTIGGLTIAIGVLVDDAIIDVENVHRRLSQNVSLAEPDRRGVIDVIFDASNEIRPAMVFATVIIALVFVPALFLQGLEGRFFQPLAMAYIISILASLLVALTLTPALCRLLLRGKGSHKDSGVSSDSWFVRKLKWAYEPMLRMALRFRTWVLGGALAATLAALLLAGTYGRSFLPSFNEGTFTVFLLAPPGTSLPASDRLAIQVEKQIAEIEGVRAVSRRTGRAERDEHAEPVSNSEIEVSLTDDADPEKVRAELDHILGSIPGITTMVGQPIEHRLSHVLSGTPAAVAINIFGDDHETLRETALRIESELQSVPGVRDVNATREIKAPALTIRYRRTDLAAFGLSPAEAAEQVHRAINGEVIDRINLGIRQYDLVVRLNADQRASVEDVRDLLLKSPHGPIVRLRDVADVAPERSNTHILRENTQRMALVSLNVAQGHNLGDLVGSVQSRVDPIVLEAGLSVKYGGQFEAQQSATRTLGVAGAGVAVVMLILLQIATHSIRAAMLIMINMPLALIGGVLAIFITADPGPISNLLGLLHIGDSYVAPVLSISSVIGFITLFGIAVRNGILLIQHYHRLIVTEGVAPERAVVQGSLERLAPILMTALAAALGLFPLTLTKGEPGSELLYPLAIVTLGGLLTSTVLNLLVVPAGYALLFRIKPQK